MYIQKETYFKMKKKKFWTTLRPCCLCSSEDKELTQNEREEGGHCRPAAGRGRRTGTVSAPPGPGTVTEGEDDLTLGAEGES